MKEMKPGQLFTTHDKAVVRVKKCMFEPNVNSCDECYYMKFNSTDTDCTILRHDGKRPPCLSDMRKDNKDIYFEGRNNENSQETMGNHQSLLQEARHRNPCRSLE